MPAFTHTSRGRTGVVGSTNPTPIVLTIIAINVVVFFLEGFGTNASVIDRYGLWPDGVHLLHQYYRAFTAMWLHASFKHIFFNMITLLIVGPALEVLLGKVRFVALYLLAGLGGSVGSYLLGPHNELGIGASGAIMGVLGAYIVVGLRRRLPVAPVAILLVFNLALGFTGNTDWRAHLGGLVPGACSASSTTTPASSGTGTRPWSSPSGGAWPSWPCWRCSSHPRARALQSQLRPGPPAPAPPRPGSAEWLTVRQKSPYCFISGRNCGTT